MRGRTPGRSFPQKRYAYFQYHSGYPSLVFIELVSNWFLTGFVSLVSAIYVLVNSGRGDLFIPPVVQIAGGVVLWFLAPAISRTVAKRNDGEAILEGVTEAQLFATAFVGLGAYFSLKSFASVFNWIHFFTINRSPEFGFNQYEDPSYYEFTEEGLTLVAGVFLMCTAKHWAAKLTRKGKIDAGGTGEQNYLTHFTGRKGRSNVPRGVTLKGPIGQVAFAKRDR